MIERLRFMNKMGFPVILITYVLLSLSCVSSVKYYKTAEELRTKKEYVKAIEYYMEAMRREPKETRYRLRLMEVMMEASNYYYRQAKKSEKEGKYELALVELNRALEYNPYNQIIVSEKKRLLKMISKEKKKNEKTEIEKLKIKTSVARSEQSRWENNERVNLKFIKPVKLSEIIKAVGKAGGMNVLFDSDFRDSKLKITLKNITLKKALERICMIKKLFYKRLDRRTLLIIPDTASKRKLYDKQILKNFYLSNIKADECAKLVSNVCRIKNIFVNKGLNMITVRETPEKVALVEKLVNFYDKRKAEVMIKVEIMEVNRDKLKEYGVELSQYQISQGMVSSSENGTIRGNRFFYLDSSDFSFTIPTILYKLLENDGESRIIAEPQVRGEDGEKIEIKLGDKVPVPRTSFVPFATGGVNQQPITSFDLLDVGIGINIIPHIHHNGEVTLDLSFRLSFITSPGSSTIPPTIGNRYVKTKIRLRDGETGVMAGLIRNSERTNIKGIPGLNRIPLLRNIFSKNKKQVTQTDIILSITPYIIKMPDISEEDLRPLKTGTESKIYYEKESKK